MSRSRMDTKELLQLAGADLLGVLEPEEQERFEQAFLQATPAVQETVRREQARAAESLLATLPHVEPPLRLRQDVLDQVLAAGGGQGSLQLVGEGGPEEHRAAGAAAAVAAASDETRWRDTPYRVGSSLFFWRAACLSLLGLSLMFGALFLHTETKVGTLAQVLKRESYATWRTRVIQIAGLPFSQMNLEKDSLTVRFDDQTDSGAQAVLTYNLRQQVAFLEVRGLSMDVEYELRYIVDEADAVAYSHRFSAESQIVPFSMLAANLPANGRWEIREVGSDSPLLVAFG